MLFKSLAFMFNSSVGVYQVVHWAIGYVEYTSFTVCLARIRTKVLMRHVGPCLLLNILDYGSDNRIAVLYNQRTNEAILAKGSVLVDIQKIYYRFPTKADCIAQLEKVWWHGIPRCPYCRAQHNTAMPAEYRYHCNRCNTTFSVTVRTVFHHTHLPFQKWFLAIFLLLNTRKSITTQQLAQELEVNKNTAWYIGQRIHTAMLDLEQRELIQRLGVSL